MDDISGDVLSDIRISGDRRDEEEEKILGLLWEPLTFMLRFQTKLKFKIVFGMGIVLTRKVVLSNVMKVFDLIPQAKLLLRETWKHGLDWNGLLLEKERIDLLCFLGSLLELNEIVVPMSLWLEGEIEELRD